MRSTFNAGVGGDNSYYSEPVSEELSWDAYSRYEVLVDDYSDVEHLLAMREPVRVASAPDPYSVPKSYACERCGVTRSKRSDRTPLTHLCSDCSFVERHAAPPPTRAAEQSAQILHCLTGNARAKVPAQNINDVARHREARRLRQQREQHEQQEHLSPREALAAKQSEQERQFLQDLQDSGAEWLLKARHK